MALKVPATLSLDQLDLALIGQLQRDGRKALTALAKDLGVSHGTVRNRLDRLRASGILRVSAVVDPAKIGYPIFAGSTTAETLRIPLARNRSSRFRTVP